MSCLFSLTTTSPHDIYTLSLHDALPISVIVPFGKGRNIIASLNEDFQDYRLFNQLMKQAQQYSVNLYDHELHALSAENLIEPLYNDSIYCLNDKAYNKDFGVTLEGLADLENLNF